MAISAAALPCSSPDRVTPHKAPALTVKSKKANSGIGGMDQEKE